MKHFIDLLLSSYQGIENSALQFEDLVNEYCGKIEETLRIRKESLDELYQHLSKKRKIQSNENTPEKMRIDNLRKRMELDLISSPEENKKILDNVIQALIRDLPGVDNHDLTDINTQQRIMKALAAFKPKTDLQKDFHDTLMIRLSEAMKIHALKLICQQYQRHLETEIIALAPRGYMSTSSAAPTDVVRIFVAENLSDVKNTNEKLNMTIQKYQAVREIQATLTTNEPADVRINHCKAVYHQKQGILNSSRDSAAKNFCKKILDFVSRFRFSHWIWGSQGRVTGKKMERVYALPSIPSRITTFSRG